MFLTRKQRVFRFFDKMSVIFAGAALIVTTYAFMIMLFFKMS